MKTKLFTLILIAMTGLLSVSCSKDNDFDPNDGKEPTIDINYTMDALSGRWDIIELKPNGIGEFVKPNEDVQHQCYIIFRENWVDISTTGYENNRDNQSYGDGVMPKIANNKIYLRNNPEQVIIEIIETYTTGVILLKHTNKTNTIMKIKKSKNQDLGVGW